MQTHCSFKSAIEKSMKAMTEAQEKNHTDHVNLSPRMLRGQLMRQAVTYLPQAGAGGTNAPLPSRKKFLLFLGPSTYCSCTELQFVFGCAFVQQEGEVYSLMSLMYECNDDLS